MLEQRAHSVGESRANACDDKADGVELAGEVVHDDFETLGELGVLGAGELLSEVGGHGPGLVGGRYGRHDVLSLSPSR